MFIIFHMSFDFVYIGLAEFLMKLSFLRFFYAKPFVLFYFFLSNVKYFIGVFGRLSLWWILLHLLSLVWNGALFFKLYIYLRNDFFWSVIKYSENKNFWLCSDFLEHSY